MPMLARVDRAKFRAPFFRRELLIIASFLAVFLAAADLPAETFDWRNYNGLNFTTPIRNQGSAGTCWAFAACGALEAKLEITAGNPNLNPNVSEQHLVCAGGMGDISGGWEFMALDFFRTTGVVAESELPYTASNTSPKWPLAAGWENRVYKIDDNDNWLPCTKSVLKSSLKQFGPLVACMDTTQDWYWPANPPAGAPEDGGGDPLGAGTLITETPAEFAGGLLDQVGAINHAVAVVGFVDDEAVTGGGYWIIRNSWGTGWGRSGYGYIRYGVLEGHGRVHAISGSAYFVPEPTVMILLGIGGILMLRRRKS
jgi:C1A family cysteine protease